MRRGKVVIVREYETNPDDDSGQVTAELRARRRDNVRNQEMSIDNVDEVTVDEIREVNQFSNKHKPSTPEVETFNHADDDQESGKDSRALVVRKHGQQQQKSKSTQQSEVTGRELVSAKPTRIKVQRQRAPSGGGSGGGRVVALRGDVNGVPDMERELDRSKNDWEKQVMKMQREFFKLTSGSVLPMGSGSGIAPGTEVTSPSRDVYETRPDGSRVFVLRFNVRGYSPAELTVRVDGRTLQVKAQHFEEGDLGEKASKDFDRKMDLPDEVDADAISSELSSDGVLTVEAPVTLPESGSAQTQQLSLPDPGSHIRGHRRGQRGQRGQQSSGGLLEITDRPHDEMEADEADAGSSFVIGDPFNAVSLKSENRVLTPRRAFTSINDRTPAHIHSSHHSHHSHHSSPDSYTAKSPFYRPPREYLDLPSQGSVTSGGVTSERSHSFTPSAKPSDFQVALPDGWRAGTEVEEERVQYHSAGGAGFITLPASTLPPAGGGTDSSPGGGAGPLPSGFSEAFAPLLQQSGGAGSGKTSSRGASHLERINPQAAKLKLKVEIGQEYRPRDIQVNVDARYIHVKAAHEEQTPSGRTAKHEYNRTFDAPEDLDLDTLQAVLGTDGQLMVVGSLLSNKDKFSALDSIRRDIPPDGTFVQVIY